MSQLLCAPQCFSPSPCVSPLCRCVPSPSDGSAPHLQPSTSPAAQHLTCSSSTQYLQDICPAPSHGQFVFGATVVVTSVFTLVHPQCFSLCLQDSPSGSPAFPPRCLPSVNETPALLFLLSSSCHLWSENEQLELFVLCDVLCSVLCSVSALGFEDALITFPDAL